MKILNLAFPNRRQLRQRNKREYILTLVLFLLVFNVYTSTTGIAQELRANPPSVTNQLGMEFVQIPPGEFIMGSTLGGPNERPHKVKITRPFFLGVTEVTDSQRGQIDTAKRRGSLPSRVPQYPDTERSCSIASWEEANQLAKTLSKLDPDFEYRLPTEAEWEYACCGGGDGNAKDDAPISQTHKPEYGVIEPIKLKPPNKFGVYDMLRNDGEYCSDWYAADYYKKSPLKDPIGPEEGTSKVARGVRSEGRDRSYSCWRRYPVPPEGDSNILIGVRFVLEEKNKDKEQ